MDPLKSVRSLEIQTYVRKPLLSLVKGSHLLKAAKESLEEMEGQGVVPASPHVPHAGGGGGGRAGGGFQVLTLNLTLRLRVKSSGVVQGGSWVGCGGWVVWADPHGRTTQLLQFTQAL